MIKAKPGGSPGYTFPLMLVILAAVAFGATRLERSASYRLRRDKEEELLFRGEAYLQAIREFHAQNRRYPRELEELASDRGPQQRRYIRQLYKDPMTGGGFKLIRLPDGAIAGVVSASKETPFRMVDFDKDLADFDKAKTYADWKFSDLPPPAAASPNAGSIAAPVPVAPTPPQGPTPY